MTESKIETTKGICVVAMTKYLMKKLNTSQEHAFQFLLSTETYSLLMDDQTRLFLEPNEYLCHCCEIELEQGIEELYKFINQ